MGTGPSSLPENYLRILASNEEGIERPYFKVRAAACGALVQMGQCQDCHSADF